MARDIGMAPGARIYRAVIVKTFADGWTSTVYEGPYADLAPARARVTYWRNHFARRRNGDRADGHVEACQPAWTKVPEPASRTAPAAAKPPAAARTPAGSTAVQLLRDALRQRRALHGRHAADLLAEHGHTAEAERIRAEVRARNGHLSAKQALHLLEQESGTP